MSSESLTAPLSLLWRHTTSQAKNNPASPVYALGNGLLHSGGFLYAINAGDGTTRWQYPQGNKAKSFFATTPALSGSALFLTDDNGQAYKLDAATGQRCGRRNWTGPSAPLPSSAAGSFFLGAATATATR